MKMTEKQPKIDSSIENAPRTEKERLNIAKRFNLPESASWEEIEAILHPKWVLLYRAELFAHSDGKSWKQFERIQETLKETKESHDSEQEVQIVELILDKYQGAQENRLVQLLSIQTKQEALTNPIRQEAIQDRNIVHRRLGLLNEYTNIELEKYNELRAKWENLAKAIGHIEHDVLVRP